MSISIFGSVKEPDVNSNNGFFSIRPLDIFVSSWLIRAWLLLSVNLRHKSFVEFGNGVLEIFLSSFVFVFYEVCCIYADAYLSSCCSARDSSEKPVKEKTFKKA
jgi:hypothetical protein